MLNVFHSTDGIYHQGGLYDVNSEVVSIVIERVAGFPGQPPQWEWMTWLTQGDWSEPDLGWHGSETTLEQAKFSALDAAIALADKAVSHVLSLPQPV